MRRLGSSGLVLALVLLGVLFAVMGCGGDDGSQTTVGFSINEPAFIDPVNLVESEGIQVGNAIFDSLVALDYKTGELIPAAAEKWECNDDATVWTFHLKDAKFHNGRAVTAADFKYAWERISNPANESRIAYHLSSVKGFGAMQEGAATELEGVKALDEKTLEVTLEYSYGDFEYVVAHPALAPVPKEEVEKDEAAFADMPIGNGPFKMAEPWAHGQGIKVVRFDEYYGERAKIGGVDFKIFTDEETAYFEFKAGTLDFAAVPYGQVETAIAEYGQSPDGLSAASGKQVLTGPELGVYLILMNNEMPPFDNPDVRRALSLAINREAIASAVAKGVQQPATGVVPEGVVGYQADQWAYSKYDIDQAKQLLANAGYPDGQGMPEIALSFVPGGGQEDLMALVQADLQKIGISSKLDALEGPQYEEKLFTKAYMVGVLVWVADYPLIDSILSPLFTTGGQVNVVGYSDASVDQALTEARGTVGDDELVEKYQDIDRTIGEAAPVIPVFDYHHHHVASERMLGLVFSSQGLANLESVSIADGE